MSKKSTEAVVVSKDCPVAQHNYVEPGGDVVTLKDGATAISKKEPEELQNELEEYVKLYDYTIVLKKDYINVKKAIDAVFESDSLDKYSALVGLREKAINPLYKIPDDLAQGLLKDFFYFEEPALEMSVDVSRIILNTIVIKGMGWGSFEIVDGLCKSSKKPKMEGKSQYKDDDSGNETDITLKEDLSQSSVESSVAITGETSGNLNSEA